MTIDTLPAYVQRVLDRLEGVRPTRDGWDAICPCPDHNVDGDQNPSLHIGLGDDGRILVKCRVGCLTDAVLDALGLDWGDLAASASPGEVAEGNGHPGRVVPARPEKADADLCHRAYELLLQELPLADEHRENLRQRGLTDVEIDQRGYRSLRNLDRGRAAKAVHQQLGDAVFGVPGFVPGTFGVTLHGEATGLLVPVRDLAGRLGALKVRRATDPKYLYLTSPSDGPSSGSPVHVPLGIATPAPLLRLTEGELKADVCTVLDGTPTIGVPGVTQWRPALPLLKELGARTVVLAFDAPDVQGKAPVFEQAEALYQELAHEAFKVELEIWNE
jgi:hypothetical protein